MHGLVALLLAYSDFDWVSLDELLHVHTNMLLNGLESIQNRGSSALCVEAAHPI